MADVKKIATRDSYGNTLKELAAEGHDDLVVLDADLAAATKTGMFQKAYPDRHFDCGIAEGNMVGVAAGLAAMGYVPFVSSFAMFAAGRAFEQVRNSVGYPHLCYRRRKRSAFGGSCGRRRRGGCRGSRRNCGRAARLRGGRLSRKDCQACGR